MTPLSSRATRACRSPLGSWIRSHEFSYCDSGRVADMVDTKARKTAAQAANSDGWGGEMDILVGKREEDCEIGFGAERLLFGSREEKMDL